MEKCYLLLGSNLGEKNENLQEARLYIQNNIGSILKHSALYETEPVGFSHPEMFINQVIEVETEFSIRDVLDRVLKIEELLGRIRIGGGYQARVIDIDILFYGGEIRSEPDLIVPHPRLHQRRFALEPLNELAPDFIHPLLKQNVQQLLNSCEDNAIVRKL